MTQGGDPSQPGQQFPPQQFAQQQPPPYAQGSPYGGPPLGYGGYPPPYYQEDNSGKATASLVLGLIGLLAWCLPIVGLPVSVIGLVMGIKGLRSSNRGMAIAGIVLNSIGLFASIVNAAIGVYLGVTGQHPLVNQWNRR